MWEYMHSYNGGGGWFGGPYMLLFLVLVVVGVVMLLWVLNANRGAGRSDPVAILKERYARGEISLEEYEEHKRNLER